MVCRVSSGKTVMIKAHGRILVVVLLAAVLGPWLMASATAQTGLVGDPPPRQHPADRHHEKVLADSIRAGLSDGGELLGTFFDALEALPDSRLDRDGLARVLVAAKLPPDGSAAALLSSFKVIEKRGDRILFQADERLSTIRGEDGEPLARIQFGRQGSLRVRRDGGRLVVDDIKGVKVGAADGSLYPARRLALGPHERGGTAAEVTVKVLFFENTVDFVIPPSGPEMVQAANSPAADGADRALKRGIVDALKGDD